MLSKGPLLIPRILQLDMLRKPKTMNRRMKARTKTMMMSMRVKRTVKRKVKRIVRRTVRRQGTKTKVGVEVTICLSLSTPPDA